jgi:hypothetical protein
MMVSDGLDVDDSLLNSDQLAKKKEYLEAIKESRDNVSYHISLLKLAKTS